MARRLIVNADDYGLSPAVSRGILDAYRRGIVTSTTFMVNLPWSEACARDLAGAPALGLGLHLNLTAGTPVLPVAAVPSLVGEKGRFRKLLRHLLVARPGEVRREWGAQVQRFCEWTGRTPTHLDSHHHVHGLPALAPVAVEVARAYGIPAIRIVTPRDLQGARPWYRRGASHWLQYWLLRVSAPHYAASGLAHPDRVIGLGDFDRSILLQWLGAVPDGVTELVCHPGYVDDELRSVSGRVSPRPREVVDLSDPDVRTAVAHLGIQLTTYASI